MNLGLVGARALVGGGSRGLGAAIATSLAAEGARVAVASAPDARRSTSGRGIGGLAVPSDLATADGPGAPCRRRSMGSAASTCWW